MIVIFKNTVFPQTRVKKCFDKIWNHNEIKKVSLKSFLILLSINRADMNKFIFNKTKHES